MRNTSRRIRRMRRERAARAYRAAVIKRLTLLFAVLAITFAAGAAAAVGISGFTTAFARGADTVYMTVTAEKGDTLWGIAREHNYGNRDIRAVVDEIMRVNDMDSSQIRAGDKLNIPVTPKITAMRIK